LTLTLYYSPGACSLSPHIALREAGLAFSLLQVNLAEKKILNGGSFLEVNPKGYVPALALENGQLLTEGAVIVQYVADQKPELELAPRPTSFERYRLQEWLNFIATELHKGFGPVNNPRSSPEAKEFFKTRLLARFEILAKAVANKTYLFGEGFTVADGYAYYVLRNLRKLDASLLDQSPALKPYFDRVAARPAVRAALEAERVAP
jgi:glutathione S-transferase